MRKTVLLLGLVLLLPAPARATEPVQALLIVAGPSPGTKTALRHVPPPIMDTSHLALALGIAKKPSGEAVEKLRRQFKAAVDDFYAGRDQRADEGFSAFTAALDENPAPLFAEPRLRPDHFFALLHRASIAFANRDDDAVTRFLTEAAERFPRLAPEASDFPPWLRQRYRVLVDTRPEMPMVSLSTEAGCEVLVDGELLCGGPRCTVALRPGRHGARTRCGQWLGPVKIFEVRDGPVEVRLCALRHGELVLEGELPWLASKAPTAELLEDASRIGRAASLSRLVVALPQEDRVVLFNALSGRKVRSMALGEAGDLIGRPRMAPDSPVSSAPIVSRPWYKDGVAAAFLLSGIAALTAGMVLAQVYGRPSDMEPYAWSLLAGGVGFAGTGIALYIVPNTGGEARSTSTGVALCSSF